MANVNIKFNNKDYLLSCDDGQEQNLKKLANHLDLKYNELQHNLGNIGENKLLLITSIKMIDDYFDLFKKVKNTKRDFEKLKGELNKFEKMIEESKSSYEQILDKTTKSIEKFIENSGNKLEKNIQ